MTPGRGAAAKLPAALPPYRPDLTVSEIMANHRRLLARHKVFRQHGLTFIPVRRKLLAMAGRLAGPILEIGAGRGLTAMALAGAGYRFTAIDTDRTMLKSAALNLAWHRLLPRVTLRQMDACALTFANNTFASIVMVDALHHLHDDNVFAEMDRVLIPGGSILLADFNAHGQAIVAAVHRDEGRSHPSSALTGAAAAACLARRGYTLAARSTATHWLLVATKPAGRRAQPPVGRYRYLYGPVPSWRLGSSLGIDPLSQPGKHCSFDCTYCQLGKTTQLTARRRVFIPTAKIVAELRRLPPLQADYITVAGRGEPTLANNLGEIIAAVKALRPEPVAVLTNATLLNQPAVRRDLRAADLVAVKLDAPDSRLLRDLNHPVAGVTFARILAGIKKFRAAYAGRFAVQIMFVPANRAAAAQLARLVRGLGPDEVQLNTPQRGGGARPLSRSVMNAVERKFRGLAVASVYRGQKPAVLAISAPATLRRRGKRPAEKRGSSAVRNPRRRG